MKIAAVRERKLSIAMLLSMILLLLVPTLPVVVQNRNFFFMHVGPLKTGTTTIQINVLKKLISSQDLAQDHLLLCTLSYKRGISLVKKSFLWLPQNRNMKPWNEFIEELYKIIYSSASAHEIRGRKRTKTIDVIVSNEAFSFVRADEHTKVLMRSLEEKWDVRIILVYRPMETWYASWYY